MKLNKILITTMLGFTLGLTGCASEQAETPEIPTTEVETPTVTEGTVDLGNGQKVINLSEEESATYESGDVIKMEGDTIVLPDALTLENKGLMTVIVANRIQENEAGEIIYEDLEGRTIENDAEVGHYEPITFRGVTDVTEIVEIHVASYVAKEDLEDGSKYREASILTEDDTPFSGWAYFIDENNISKAHKSYIK